MPALEQEIAALRDEVQKLTAITTKLYDARVDAIETVRSAATKAKPAKKTEDKQPEEKAETPKEEKVEAPKEEKVEAPKEEKVEAPKEETSKATTANASADELSDESMKSHAASYVNYGSTDDQPLTQEEREARMSKVREVLAHDKIKAKTVAEVPQNARKAFRKKINDFIAEIDSNGQLTATEAEVDDL